jgi:hypothetical protein
VHNPASHFPERCEPLCGSRALLCRRSLPVRHIKRPGEPLVVSAIGLTGLLITMDHVSHDIGPGWGVVIDRTLLLDHRT